MNYEWSYLSICLKKAFKKYIAIFITTVFLLTVLFFVAQMIISINQNDVSRQRVKLGIVGDLTDSYMGIGFSTIESIDDMGMSVEFIEMDDEEEAEEALIESDISAYILVPPNYISDLAMCKDVKVSFVMPKSAAASGALMREVVKIISPLVTEAEAGILGMREYHTDTLNTSADKNVNVLNMKYIDTILNRADTIELKTVGIQSLSLIEYYACGILTFFILLFALSCCTIFADKHLALGRLLCSKNIKSWQMVMCEYFAYVVVMFVTVFVIFSSLIFLPESIGFDVAETVKTMILSIPCILMIASMHFFIYEISGSIITGVLFQFIVAVFMGYISGCFYPYYFFPETVQTVAGLLPSGVLFEVIREFVSGMFYSSTLVPCFVYTALFLSLSIAVRKYRLRRGLI